MSWLLVTNLPQLTKRAIVIIRKTAQLKGDTGPTFSEVGGLFEGVGELQDAEVLLVAAYDLQSDGQAFG
jgi:hypothetical protein